MNFMFSAKELDKETGFYYYGARYLDPKYSRWISADPAMNTGEYFPQAPVNDEAKKHNHNLPGMGGVFNAVNFNVYHYAGNNPVKYTDPDGRDVISDDVSQNDEILKDITLIAGDGFSFDESGNLQVDESVKPGEKYNKEIRAELISLIKGKNKNVKVYIKYSLDFTDMCPDGDGNFVELTGCQNLGKTAYGDPEGKTYRVCIPNQLYKNSNGERASIFIHEFMGHLVPTIAGKTGGNAVRDTMPMIRSLGLSIPEFLKLAWSEPECEFHDGALPGVKEQGWVKK